MPIPRAIIIDDQPYELLEVGPNRRQWTVTLVPSQPGDGSKAKPHFLEAHGGFGVSHRHTNPRGPVGATHHNYAENVQTLLHGTLAASPRITYIDCSLLSGTGGSFRLGGFTTSRLGGATTAGLGGGSDVFAPRYITEYGDYLYANAEHYTYTIDPVNGTLVEARFHGTGAQARSSDVFDNILVVALGSNNDAEVATTSYNGTTPTTWGAAVGVQMAVYRVGGSGRLFAAQDNLIFNVLPGQNPATLANYLPTGGEVITDETNPVRGIEEFARGLVAGTARAARTFDPEAGYISRAITPRNRLSASDYDGRGILNTGEYLLFADGRSVWMITPNGQRLRAGPEVSDFNESPYIGGQPGIPDVAGEWVYWPYYFPDSGDSVIFAVRRREQGDPGIGPLMWSDFLYLQDREVRCVRYWGGNTTVKPRLFFGAGTTSNKEQVGYVDLGSGGGPDLFNTDAVPALSGTLYYPHDDFGLPGVVRDVERIEVPDIQNAGSTDYWVASISDDGGATYKNLVKAQSGSNQERMNSSGFNVVFAQVASVPSARELIVKLAVTQASGATTFCMIRGEPVLYLSERPTMVQQVSTLLRAHNINGIEDTKDIIDRLEATVVGQKKQIRHQPGDETIYARVYSVREVEIELESPAGRREREVAVEIIWREVATA